MSAGRRPFTRLPTVRWLAEVAARPRRVALGTFDGVHVGHREVIAGSERVVTFSPHPRAVLGSPPPLLQDPTTKFLALGDLGVTEVVLIPFDRQTASMSPAEFIDRVLVGALDVSRVAVGENFRFGRGGSGSVADLAADPRFETVVHGLVSRQGAIVSSTRIRELVAAGRLEDAAALLGDRFTVGCPVVGWSDSAGLRLGWPTDVVRPPAGTYAAVLHPTPEAAAIAADLTLERDAVRLPSGPRLDRGREVRISLLR